MKIDVAASLTFLVPVIVIALALSWFALRRFGALHADYLEWTKTSHSERASCSRSARNRLND